MRITLTNYATLTNWLQVTYVRMYKNDKKIQITANNQLMIRKFTFFITENLSC